MIRRMTALAICVILAALCLMPALAEEDSERKVVRVGWYDTPFNRKDAYGRRSGYAYEYERKIAAYTGWKYEYVEGSWYELLQMLKDGRIDLMSDVSFTEDRKDQMLFSSFPMGSEMYYLYIHPENREISREDVSTLNGKRIGITRSTVQVGLFHQWAETHGVEVELIELETSEEDSLDMLARQELDGFITLDYYGNDDKSVPTWKIGSSDFYFAVNKDRNDLLAELDAAMNRIQEENRHYHEELSVKYLQNNENNRYLTPEEKEWLESHGPIRVGYQDNYLAFCAKDPATGELTGALKDYLEIASSALSNAQPVFETVCYATAAEAMVAMRRGEVDVMFPANLTDYDGEVSGVVMSAPIMRTEMDAVVREEDKANFLRKTQVRVGVNQGNPNYEMFLLDHFPNWTPVYYKDSIACLDAIAAKGADCLIISNYRYNNIARQCEKLHLTTVYTGVDMDYCFAVKEGNTALYSILAKIVSLVPESTVNAALTYYSSETVNASFLDHFQDTWSIVIGAVGVLLIEGVIILIWRLTKRKKNG